MEEDDWHEDYESDDTESELDQVLPPLPRIFNFLRESMSEREENFSDTESVCSNGEQTAESTLHEPDEQTRTSACEHQYLGELEQIRGRVIMDDGSIQKIPLLFPASAVMLVPGQTFPLMECEEAVVNVLKYAVEGDHIFGIISPALWDPARKDVVGTTAEIYEYAQTENGYKIKAKGRQRFKVLQYTTELINDHYIRFAFIKILPEISLTQVLDGGQLPSLNRFRTSQRFKCLRRESSQMRWPFWVYRNYDEKHLIQKVKKKVTEHCKSKNIVLPNDATTLSFLLLKIVPISQKLVLEAMKLNSPIQRLRWIINILDSQTSKLLCATCKKTIGYQSDIFAMSAEGPHGTYVNSVGYVHELITLKKVKNTKASGAPETVYSWFPGYAWIVLTCSSCQSHLGWKFTSCKKELTPTEFWGIKNNSIFAKFDKNMEMSMPARSYRPYQRLHAHRIPRID